jgi:hypothetical protein
MLGVGGKDVAISLTNIKADNNRVTLDRTKEQLQQQMAEYRPENRNTGGRNLGFAGPRRTAGHRGRYPQVTASI